jgi:hypothetical protein
VAVVVAYIATLALTARQDQPVAVTDPPPRSPTHVRGTP